MPLSAGRIGVHGVICIVISLKRFEKTRKMFTPILLVTPILKRGVRLWRRLLAHKMLTSFIVLIITTKFPS